MQERINFRDPAFLSAHIAHTLAFYDARCVDPRGGFFQCYYHDGSLFEPELRSLVASCRFIFNYAKAYQYFGSTSYRDKLLHGLSYLRDVHRNPLSAGYTWKINHAQPVDETRHCYGLAFVLLAYACALEAGITEARAWIDETYDVLETHFWRPDEGRYASEADAHWALSSYRGQNDNMHACEALIAAYEATGETHFIERALTIATAIASPENAFAGHIWEHFSPSWQVDLEYNRNDKSNNLRPWGVQTGHQTEWAKLLLILARHRPQAWFLTRAEALFNNAVRYAWDAENGGLMYGYDWHGTICDDDKYFWVQAESIAAAALLATATGETKYWIWYDKLWAYSFKHFVDHQYGAWYRILSRTNQHYDQRKSYNNKTDYHTMGACYEVLKNMRITTSFA